MNTPTDKIKELQSEISRLEYKIKNCKHSDHWKETKFDPETVKEGYGSVQDGAGSDPHWSYVGYMDKEVPRWSRTCSECGYTEYTYERGPVEPQKLEPKFK